MLSIIVRCCTVGVPVAAICHGPWMLCSARYDDGTPVAAAPLHYVVYRDGDEKEHCLADGELWEILPEPERKRQRA